MSVEPEQTAAETSHLALARCREAFEQTISAAPAGVRSEFAAKLRAIQAYKCALPPLIGAQNIRDFIACIAQGMLLGAIEDNQASRLIYAARSAQSTLRGLPAGKPAIQPDPIEPRLK